MVGEEVIGKKLTGALLGASVGVGASDGSELGAFVGEDVVGEEVIGEEVLGEEVVGESLGAAEGAGVGLIVGADVGF